MANDEMSHPPSASLAGARSWLRIGADPLRAPDETRQLVTDGARLSVNYLVMNAAATLIAGYGLLANSEAVIIGAMLIAMLYGPILAIGLAFAELDGKLLGRALIAEIVGALWVFSIGLLLGWLHFRVPVSDQMLSRTAPNILDLMIALVGGAAGAYAAAAPRVSAAVVGVAIATALCPPLTACGILVAHGYPRLALGAFILFFTNLTAIAAAAMAVFLAMGHRARRSEGAVRTTWAARAAPLLILLVLGIYLVDAFRATIEDTTLRDTIQRSLESDIADNPGARVIEVQLAREGSRRVATAVIRTPRPFTRETVARLDDTIDKATGRDVSLHVRTVLVEELTREGPMTAPQSERGLIGR